MQTAKTSRQDAKQGMEEVIEWVTTF